MKNIVKWSFIVVAVIIIGLCIYGTVTNQADIAGGATIIDVSSWFDDADSSAVVDSVEVIADSMKIDKL